MKFFTLCPKGGALDSLFCPEGRVFVHNDCAGGTVLLPSSRVLSRGVAPGGGMVLDEIDTCITNLNFLSIRPQKSGFKSLPRRTF